MLRVRDCKMRKRWQHHPLVTLALLFKRFLAEAAASAEKGAGNLIEKQRVSPATEVVEEGGRIPVPRY
jgi:hypothetical protein